MRFYTLGASVTKGIARGNTDNAFKIDNGCLRCHGDREGVFLGKHGRAVILRDNLDVGVSPYLRDGRRPGKCTDTVCVVNKCRARWQVLRKHGRHIAIGVPRIDGERQRDPGFHRLRPDRVCWRLVTAGDAQHEGLR